MMNFKECLKCGFDYKGKKDIDVSESSHLACVCCLLEREWEEIENYPVNLTIECDHYKINSATNKWELVN